MASIILATDKYKNTKAKGRFTLVHGRRISYDKTRDPVHFTRPASDQSMRYVYKFYGEKVARLTEIKLTNHDGITGATSRIDQGGVGNSFVEIMLTSKPEQGVNYTIQIRVLNRTQDIRYAQSARSFYSPHNLVEGKETIGSVLRPPVMSIASTNNSRVFFDYYGSPDAAITKIEVLDYSRNARHGGTPMITEGGVGQNHVEMRCVEMPLYTARFMVKLYIHGDERSLHEIDIQDE